MSLSPKARVAYSITTSLDVATRNLGNMASTYKELTGDTALEQAVSLLKKAKEHLASIR